jgi:capsular exopolysaccharide synthesis family protein
MLVTSSGPQEGKSTTVASLGIAMAQSGNRVLVMDTDMRRPRLHKAFGVANEVGVTSLLVSESSVHASLKSTEVPGLFVLPCGPIPPNPAELLHTQAFSDLLKELSAKFDRVILDSPPLAAVADAAILGTQVDGVVLVVRARHTPREMAIRGVRSLQDVNAKIFGVVLNNVNLEDPKYGDYYYAYRGYGYYQSEGKNEAA